MQPQGNDHRLWKIGARMFLCALWMVWTAGAHAATQTIVPGGDWYDNAGNHVNATEGGILKSGSLYYLWGMDRSQDNSTFIGVNLYSSPDLKNWTYVNQILSSSSNSLLGGGAVIERAKILYNASTNQYVMWMHYEDHNAYNTAEVAYATCPTLSGNYTFQNHFRPMGTDSRDMDVYQDTDGTAYLLCSTNGNQNITIYQLDPTYTSVTGQVFSGAASNGFNCEGHGMIKNGGTYFWITSSCSGWAFNDNHYYYATSLAGPWTSGGDVAPAGDATYESQVCWAFPVASGGQTTFIYMGDRWSVSNFSMSRMVMLPIQVSGTSLKVPWYDEWGIDAQAATWSAGPTITFPGMYKVVNRQSGKVLEVFNFSSAPGTIVDQYTDNGGTNQQWTINNIGGSDYQFTNVNSGLMLDINGASTVVGAPGIQWTSTGGNNQKWHIIDSSQGAGYYRLINVGTLEKDLEIPGGSAANGVTAELGTFNYSDYQEWQFVRVDATPTPTTDPVSTPTATRTASMTPSATASRTPTASFTTTGTASITATASPTQTATPTATRTASMTPSATASSTPSRTPTASLTSTASTTATFTPTVTRTASHTATATFSSTASPTTANTSTPSSTATASTTATPSETASQSLTASFTSTDSTTPTPSATLTASRTPSPTPTLTATPSSTASRTPTASLTPTGTPSNTPSGTPTLTAIATATLSPTGTTSSTFTATPTSSPTLTPTPSSTPTPSRTDSPTSTASPSPTLTASISPTNTGTSTGTPSSSPSLTASRTPSPTASRTSSPTLTATVTASWTPSLTATTIPSSTPTSSPTVVPIVSETPVVFPNPAKGPGPVTLQFALGVPAEHVEILVFTTAFRLVNRIELANVPQGIMDVTIPLTDRLGSALADGLYYVVVETPHSRSVVKLMVLR